MKLRTVTAVVSLVVSFESLSSASASTAGATYFITNEPTGNFIVSADIGSNGLLTFASAVSAGGKGAHIIPDLTICDPFNTQGSVRISSAGNLLATVNAGSNTVVIFSIDSQRPSTIKMIGSPVPSGGNAPVSVVISKNGERVCVLNGGTVNGVNCFSVDQRHGLTPLPHTLRILGLNLTDAPGTLSDIIFSEDGTKLIVAVKSVSDYVSGFLATWDVAADGSLSSTFTKSGPASGIIVPFGMTIIPGKNAVIASEPLAGYEIFNFKGNAATTTVFSIRGQLATCWVSYSPSIGNFFFIDPTRSSIAEVHVDNNLSASVVRQYPQKNGTSVLDSDVATIENKDFLYVLSPNSLTIEVSVAVGPGQLLHLQSFDFSAGARRAGVTATTPNIQGMAAFVKGS